MPPRYAWLQEYPPNMPGCGNAPQICPAAGMPPNMTGCKNVLQHARPQERPPDMLGCRNPPPPPRTCLAAGMPPKHARLQECPPNMPEGDLKNEALADLQAKGERALGPMWNLPHQTK